MAPDTPLYEDGRSSRRPSWRCVSADTPQGNLRCRIRRPANYPTKQAYIIIGLLFIYVLSEVIKNAYL